MANNKNIKKCRYQNCTHQSRTIDISKEQYTLKGKSAYYHPDCYEKKNSEDQKTTSTKFCRYDNCKHNNRELNIGKENHVFYDRNYYHIDCYIAKSEEDERNKAIKADIQLIKNLWIENISSTVVYSQLYKCLDNLIQRGIDSKYLVFVMQYVISHKLNLNYPPGFQYFVDNKEIKDAYARKQLKPNKDDKPSFFVVEDKDTAPKFSVNRKSNGFSSILGEKNN